MGAKIFENFDLPKLSWLIVIGLVMFTFGWGIIQQIFNIDKSINFGLGWTLLLIAGMVVGAFTLLQRAQRKDVTISRINVFIMLIAIGILIFLLLNIKQLVPSIFQQAVFDLKSMIGMG